MPRVVAITGVGSETAAAAAAAFARRGDRLVLISHAADAVDALVAEVRRRGARVMGLVVDTADPDAVESAVATVEDTLGPVDVWVNTAGDPTEGSFGDHEPGEFRRITEQSYLGHVHATMAVLERMRERDRGTVVHVVTAVADRGRAGQPARSGAEAALRGFHEAVADELRAERSRVRLALVRRPDGEPAQTAAQTAAAAVVRAAAGPRRARAVAGLGGVVGLAAGAAAMARRRR